MRWHQLLIPMLSAHCQHPQITLTLFLISMRWHQLVILLLLLLVVVEAAKKKPSKGELGMIIRMSRMISDDKSSRWL